MNEELSEYSSQKARSEYLRQYVLPIIQREAFDPSGKIRGGVLEKLEDFMFLFGVQRDRSTISRMLHGMGEMFTSSFSDPNIATAITLCFDLDQNQEYMEHCRLAGVTLPSEERFTAWHELNEWAKENMSRINDFRFASLRLREARYLLFRYVLAYPQVYPNLVEAVSRAMAALKQSTSEAG